VTAGIKFEIVHYPPKPIVSADLAFDDTHINQERQHGVTLPVAQDIIDTALFSLTGWKGRSERYYDARSRLRFRWVYTNCVFRK
jgi:hypothetical protein